MTAAATYFCYGAADTNGGANIECDTAANIASWTVAAPGATAATSVPTNCTAGTYTTGSSGTWVCQACSGGTLYSGACVTTITGCGVYASATTCSSAASGYHLASAGATTTTLCTAGNPCSSGTCGTGLALNISGNCISATLPSNCYVVNGTSSCALCAGGYATLVGTCGACPSNCGTCTSSTVCSVCNTGYTASSAGACTAKSAATSGAKSLFAGLAFISMIFYYLF